MVAHVPEIVSLERPFPTAVGDWKIEELEKPREFAWDTCVRYAYRFSRPVDGGLDERNIIVLVPKDEIEVERRDEELREMIRSRLVYSTEEDSVLNPYGCPIVE